ncbi:hypothetical protein ACFOZ7_01775 [Natribaculum luteum]|uniref:Restriction endonuclease n=1 Tax=Natribaculum luteum TaxID=1586232 RepID=A0ABD5NUH4_9EURY|nr:hypothetical protein [Natribaculum luteum]
MADLLDRIRRPEYTGDDRCWPCTIANGAVLALVAGGLVLLGRRATAAVVTAVGVAAIGLRGYLVPYTPRFAPRLVAALPVGAIDRDEPDSLSDADFPGRTADTPTGDEVVAALLEAGVVVPRGEEFLLEESFRADWRREMQALAGRNLEGLAAVADDLTPPAVEARPRRDWGRSSVVLDGPAGLVSLPEAVAVAELAAARALEPRVDDDAIRLAAGRPLRSLLERCPLCDGDLTITQSTCCGEVTPIGETPPEKLVCPDCDVQLFTYE